ncbi:MAG: xylanase [Lachnospiraceae bacterium]|nr:xylanase [Lachnospiraceae bacterium]
MKDIKYVNYLNEIGVDDKTADRMVSDVFNTLFFDEDECLVHKKDEDAWCMVDTGNIDARTEGMSYGMMMCVQMDRQDIFDKLWTFADRYMRQREGRFEGYFAWSVGLDGSHNQEGPAPDGEEYFAMALFMAAARWGDKEGIYDYTANAREILRHCVHQHELVEGGEPMWEPENKYIRFVPDVKFSDPSYHLPHLYEVFALKADEEDRGFWKEAAAASREYIIKSAHPVTGLSAEYAEYDGKPVLLFNKPWEYYSDSYRVLMNIALDDIWFGPHEGLPDIATRVQDFFHEQDMTYLMAYQIDGTVTDEPAMHPIALKAALASASIVSKSEYRKVFLQQFITTRLRQGKRRYYDNCLYFFSLLMLTGNYRLYI